MLESRSNHLVLRLLRFSAILALQWFAPVSATAVSQAETGVPGAVQSPQSLDWSVHDAGNLVSLVTNWGLVGSQPGRARPYSNEPSALWPAGSTTEYLWAGGLWIGAIKNGEPHVTTAQFQEEFRPGTSEFDHIYRTHEGALGGARAPSPDADDDHDGKIDEDWPDGRDNDSDGRVDEDFAAISDQMFACEYNDSDPSIRTSYPEHVPLDVLVQQSSLAWSQPMFDDFIPFDLKIINRGFEPLDQLLIGFFADCDIGDRSHESVSTDDRAGFWEGNVLTAIGARQRNVKVSIGYMFDADGDNQTASGYIGFAFLGAQDSHVWNASMRPVQLRNFRMFSGRASFDQGGDPTDDAERYRVLAGTAPQSLPPADPKTGLRPAQLAARDDDYRITISIGPYETLEPGDTLNVQMAMVLGRMFEGMVENAVQAQILYDGVWFDCDHDPTTGVAGRETPICGPAHAGEIVRIDPCDSLCDFLPPPDPLCYETVPSAGCAWVNADCDVEEQTGWMTGVDGQECQIHWTTEATVPAAVQDLEARSDQTGVRLAWKVSRQALGDARVVRVLRAALPEGPYSLRSADLEPAASMSFEDASDIDSGAYWYRIVLVTGSGLEMTAASIRVTVAGSTSSPTALAVTMQRGSDAAQIEYRVGTPGPIDLGLFDMRGRRVRLLYRGWRDAGSYSCRWDGLTESGLRVARGIYVVRLGVAGQRVARKLVLASE